jgi:1-deoxyxylulose-5-phosphate synthase
MEYRTLGKTDLKVSRISLGAMTFGSQVQEKEAVQIVDSCLDAGINFFDTANAYNGGGSETILGNALRGRRHLVVLSTKVGMKTGADPDSCGLSRAAIRKGIDDSLRRLGTDYIDLYYLHVPDWDTRIEETLATMNALVEEGKIRYPATSNYASWQILQMLWYCENHGFVAPTVSQPMYNLLARGIEQEYLPFCKEYGIGTVAYNPLAGGLLAGKHTMEGSVHKGTRFDSNELYRNRYWHRQNFEAIMRLQEIARCAGTSLVRLSFRWLLSRPVDSVLVGVSSSAQLDENVSACHEPTLSEDVLAECDAVWETLRGVVPKYNR